MTLVRQAAANEVAVPSGAECETWIDEHKIHDWAMAGWITVVTMTCCILIGLVLLWWKSGRVTETIDSGTQTLEEGRCSRARQGRTLQKRKHILVEISCDSVSELVFSLRSKRRIRKARLEAVFTHNRPGRPCEKIHFFRSSPSVHSFSFIRSFIPCVFPIRSSVSFIFCSSLLFIRSFIPFRSKQIPTPRRKLNPHLSPPLGVVLLFPPPPFESCCRSRPPFTITVGVGLSSWEIPTPKSRRKFIIF